MRYSLISSSIPILALAMLASAGPAFADDLPKPNDNLNAVLWDQTSVEAKANAIAIYELAKIRLDQALADTSTTAAPVEQTGDFKDKPPAVILDVDDTILNTSGYQAWNIKAQTSFSPQTWTAYVKSQTDAAISGAVDFTQYAASKGVKVFYVTNRTVEEEGPTVELMTKLGFAMGGNVDTFLSKGEKDDWKSAKGTRRAFIAKDYRIVEMFGDNFGDFTDSYKGTLADRDKTFADNAAHWGHDWFVIANPTYGSFEEAAHNYKWDIPADEQRKMKVDALSAWDGK